MKIWLRIIGGLLATIIFSIVLLLTWVDRKPYQQKKFYRKTMTALDSLQSAYHPSLPDSLRVGWAKVSITPSRKRPLAGYGARDPKTFQHIHDSIFVKAVVFENASNKAAIIAADLLIIHPEVTQAVHHVLKEAGWEQDEVFFTATHSHSSLGAWAPGFVGNLFSGAYDSEVIHFIANQIVRAIKLAQERQRPGSVGYGELSVPDLVKNRLVGEEGEEDPWLKLISIRSGDQNGLFSTYSAHATCLSPEVRDLSGDYPFYYNEALTESTFNFSAFAAGAVASMGPDGGSRVEFEEAQYLGSTLAEQAMLGYLVGKKDKSIAAIRSLRFPIYLRKPNMKVSTDLRLRPWVFHKLFGDYQPEIASLKLGDILLIGTPCDFSGELALPLYQYARDRGLHLIITSFNGGYIGYVPHDRWYDLERYETRTMSWYGHDNGAYFSEVIKRVIDINR
ncbi:MAG: neutral/alkaline non-lysosomal ceramidase N-terminal domain-containing protein [Cyclobacteriaceae bacterium]|nr:neutral/alkaline non-lysosomal ceramidase N-terminal domain-containing protein [Cyclobacteriaceae bacterium HetDA_MAG_MS6]